MPHNVLWTGGWDSTFRVLHLIHHERTVRPFYVMDPTRQSTSMEIKTMGAIREALSGAANRILPLEVRQLSEIPPDPSITAAWENLRKAAYLGIQYDWLARLATSLHLDALELCIHRGTGAHAFLKGKVVRDEREPPDDVFRLSDSDRDLTIFSRFTFPLFDMTKIEMGDLAAERGFAAFMEKTWFCHTPRNGKPCGECAPCRYTREGGLERRVPPPSWVSRTSRRLRRKLRSLTRPP